MPIFSAHEMSVMSSDELPRLFIGLLATHTSDGMEI